MLNSIGPGFKGIAHILCLARMHHHRQPKAFGFGANSFQDRDIHAHHRRVGRPALQYRFNSIDALALQLAHHLPCLLSTLRQAHKLACAVSPRRLRHHLQ